MSRNLPTHPRPEVLEHYVHDAGGNHMFVDTPAGMASLIRLLAEDARIGSSLAPRPRPDGLVEWHVVVRPITARALASRLRSVQEPAKAVAVPQVWVKPRSRLLDRLRLAAWLAAIGLCALTGAAIFVSAVLFAWSVANIIVGAMITGSVLFLVHWLADRCGCCPMCGRRR